MIEVQMLVDVEFIDGPAVGRLRRVAGADIAGVPPTVLITAVDNWSAGTVAQVPYHRLDVSPTTNRWHYSHAPSA